MIEPGPIALDPERNLSCAAHSKPNWLWLKKFPYRIPARLKSCIAPRVSLIITCVEKNTKMNDIYLKLIAL